MNTGLGRFADSVAVVVGGAHGIGRACAVRLAAEGVRVAVADLEQKVAEQVVADLPPASGRHLAVWLDVTDAASVDQAFGEAVSRLGGLDVLVNVAGGDDPTYDRFEGTSDDLWVRMLDFNLLGVVRCCRAAIPPLRRSTNNPAIVNVSSVNALTALHREPYAAAKAGIGSLTVNLAADLAPDGIRVNAVAPGTVRTRNWDHQEGGADVMRHLYPLGRVGEPEDIAAAVAFLASSDAAWITGQMLPVEGGLLTGPGGP